MPARSQHPRSFRPSSSFIRDHSTGRLVSAPNRVCTLPLQETDWSPAQGWLVTSSPWTEYLFFFFLTTPFLVSSGQDVFFFLFLRREK